jgi:hypothetical protein
MDGCSQIPVKKWHCSLVNSAPYSRADNEISAFSEPGNKFWYIIKIIGPISIGHNQKFPQRRTQAVDDGIAIAFLVACTTRAACAIATWTD